MSKSKSTQTELDAEKLVLQGGKGLLGEASWYGTEGAKRFSKIREAVPMREALTSLRSSYHRAKHLPRCEALQTRRKAAVFLKKGTELVLDGCL